MSKFRIIPSIEQLRQRDTVIKLETKYGHRAVMEALRKETETLRSKLSDESTNLIESEAAACKELVAGHPSHGCRAQVGVRFVLGGIFGFVANDVDLATVLDAKHLSTLNRVIK
mgnify:CR=1 FL=1